MDLMRIISSSSNQLSSNCLSQFLSPVLGHFSSLPAPCQTVQVLGVEREQICGLAVGLRGLDWETVVYAALACGKPGAHPEQHRARDRGTHDVSSSQDTHAHVHCRQLAD